MIHGDNSFIAGRLFVFDMDGTLLPKTTACLEIARVSKTVDALLELERQFANEVIDSKEFARELHCLWSFIDRDLVLAAFTQSPKLENIETVMRLIADQGGTSCLMTMSPDYYAGHFYRYGIDVIKSSEFPKTAGAQVEFEKILSPEDKPVLVEEICRVRGLNVADTVAFGDSGSDIPLFNRLRYTIAVNGSPGLRAIAGATYEGNDLLEAFRLVPHILSQER